MEKHVQIFLNRISYASITIATLTLLFLFLQTPDSHTCVPVHSPPPITFPRSSCDSSPRRLTTLDNMNHRLWSTHSWQAQVSSYSAFFRSLRLLHNHSKVLCVSAGAGHEAMALSQMGLADVTAVELVDSPPLVNRADPHNLPFFDGVFDLAFSAHLAESLFPSRFVSEMERTVRPGGACVVVVAECGDWEVAEIVGLFRNSRFFGSMNVTLNGSRLTRIIVRRTKGISS